MPAPERIAQLEQRVADFRRALQSFEQMRARLLAQRQNATDSAMLRLDAMLGVNARTLASLRGALDLAAKDLARERGRP